MSAFKAGCPFDGQFTRCLLLRKLSYVHICNRIWKLRKLSYVHICNRIWKLCSLLHNMLGILVHSDICHWRNPLSYSQVVRRTDATHLIHQPSYSQVVRCTDATCHFLRWDPSNSSAAIFLGYRMNRCYLSDSSAVIFSGCQMNRWAIWSIWSISCCIRLPSGFQTACSENSDFPRIRLTPDEIALTFNRP